jgi:hypothetical protein
VDQNWSAVNFLPPARLWERYSKYKRPCGITNVGNCKEDECKVANTNFIHNELKYFFSQNVLKSVVLISLLRTWEYIGKILAERYASKTRKFKTFLPTRLNKKNMDSKYS